MTISNPYPYNLTNGTTADATQVMANFNQIQSDVNANAAHNGANSDITSLNGLTSPISPSSGGTVVYTATTATNTANAYVVATAVPGNWNNTQGNILEWVPNATNAAGAVTLAVEGEAAASVEKVNAAGTLVNPAAGDIVSGVVSIVFFNGTDYILLNPVTGPTTNATIKQDGSGNLTTPWYTAGTIASATSTDLGTINSQIINITGTTTVTSFGSSATAVSPLYFLQFTGILTLTNNNTSLQLPGSANITTANGDSAVALYLGSGNWKVLSYNKSTGTSGAISPASGDLVIASAANVYSNLPVGTTGQVLGVVSGKPAWTSGLTVGGPVATTSGTSITASSSIPATAKRVLVNFNQMSTSGTAFPLVQLVTGAGIVSTGYVATGFYLGAGPVGAASTVGFPIRKFASGNVMSGTLSLELENSSTNTWVCHAVINGTVSTIIFITAGGITLNALLTGINITTTNGTDTFNGGEVNVTYE